MAKIQSGATVDELIVDPTSKAARVTLYDPAGNPINLAKPNKFFLPINLDVTVIQAANSYIWSVRNGATKKMIIDDILLNLGFRGTAAATSQVFELVRFSGANMAAGTAYTLGSSIAKKTSTGANSTVQDARFNSAAALTVSGVVFEPQAISAFGVSRSVSSQQVIVDLTKLDLELLPNEGIAIRATAATVVGDTVQGHLHWTEE
jgi:predicted RecA/RadA family phage recombinase